MSLVPTTCQQLHLSIYPLFPEKNLEKILRPSRHIFYLVRHIYSDRISCAPYLDISSALWDKFTATGQRQLQLPSATSDNMDIVNNNTHFLLPLLGPFWESNHLLSGPGNVCHKRKREKCWPRSCGSVQSCLIMRGRDSNIRTKCSSTSRTIS